MSLRLRATFGAVVLGLAVAPAAEAAKKKPRDFKVQSLTISKTSVVAGDTVDAYGRVRNRNAHRPVTGRVTYTLRTSRSAKRGTRLGGDNIKTTRPGSSRRFFERLRIPAATTPGVYFLTACVRRGSGAEKAWCLRTELQVTARPTPPSPPTPPGPPADNRSASEKLRAAISADGMLAHLRAFSDIAEQHGGNRASGFQGYGASVQYVLTQLRAAGYNPSTQVFSFVVFTENTPPTFQKTAPPPTRTYEPDDDDNPDDVEFATMSYSASGDSEADLTPIDVNLDPTPENRTSTSGCEDADFADFTAGDIALIQRGTCTFYEKALNAQEAGASGVVIFNQGNNAGRVDVVAGTLGEEAQDGDAAEPDITIPVIGTSYQIGEELATEDGTTPVRVNVIVDASNDRRSSTNVLADTPTGNPDRVVVVGSHLDSVQEGPGINDNGSGSAFNLELAIQMSKLGIQPTNRVRFAFWGAEESGLVGATRYVAALSEADWGRLAANLNFDMLASPNHGKFVYDGDFSDSPPPATAPDVNEGAARIEREFVNYFNSQNIPTEPTAFDGRSDYKPFQDTGVPAGGLFSGAEQAKTVEQQAKWGGTAGMPFDPNYHEAGDTISNLDLVGFEQMADGAAHVSAVLATDSGVRNVGGGAEASDSRSARRAQRTRAVDSKASDWLGKRLQR
jgi:Zn-dependent M28 family amino/carboxypeptidase